MLDIPLPAGRFVAVAVAVEGVVDGDDEKVGVDDGPCEADHTDPGLHLNRDFPKIATVG